MSWLPKKCLVVPIDFSDASFGALDSALQMVENPSAIHVVHVLQELSPVEPGEVWDAVDNETRRASATKALREKLADEKFQGVNIEVLFGDPGHGIANFAQELEAELIVLPSHGRTGLSRLLIGSVAERVARLAHCPVLVLRK